MRSDHASIMARAKKRGPLLCTFSKLGRPCSSHKQVSSGRETEGGLAGLNLHLIAATLEHKTQRCLVINMEPTGSAVVDMPRGNGGNENDALARGRHTQPVSQDVHAVI